ncbi:MAG: hypothetical protein SX243_14600 [Acidobacteriota bacterium]|nr:hypothetical protein [Acidobacteriota bacterium]
MQMEKLATLSPAHCRLLVKNNPKYQTAALAEAIQRHCLSKAPQDPLRAAYDGTLSLEICSHLDSQVYGGRVVKDLRALGLAVTGNAFRVLQQPREAQKYLDYARKSQDTGTGLPSLEAQLSSLEASFLASNLEFERASRLLEGAADILVELREEQTLAKIYLQSAFVCRESDNAHRSLDFIDQALLLLGPSSDPRLLMSALHNRMLCKIDLGFVYPAEEELPILEEVTRRHGGRLDQIRLAWTKGELMLRQGRFDSAEGLFLSSYRAFLGARTQTDAGLVALRLGHLYKQTGKKADLHGILQEAVEVFRTLGAAKHLREAYHLLA